MRARLHSELVVHDGATPVDLLLLTHGIYGSGGNWRAIARQIVTRRPSWGVVLVDLRGHGRSDSGSPPHTIEACADDVRGLVGDLHRTTSARVRALVGHSFGGKVMLLARSMLATQIEQTWLMDSCPSARPEAFDDPDNSVIRVLRVLGAQPRTWDRRDAFVTALVGSGLATDVAQWLATNLTSDPDAPGSLRLRLDLATIEALVRDYYLTDLWRPLEDPAGGEIEVVVASRGDVFTAEDLARLEHAPAHIRAHRVDAGHWLNVDAPAAVVSLLDARLPASR